MYLQARLTAQKKFSTKDLFSKYDQIRSFLRIWSHLLKKPLKENFIFGAVTWFWQLKFRKRKPLTREISKSEVL